MAKQATTERAADVKSALAWLEAHGTVRYRDQLATRFAIHTDKSFGTSMVDIKRLAKTIGKDQELAQALWNTGWHEAKALASFVADPKLTTPTMMDTWCRDFINWADCDTACFVLFDKTPHALTKVKQWAKRKPEFEKRAAFALLASCALHDKKGPDEPYLELLPLATVAASDKRNFVKKAVSWALRSLGGRSAVLHEAALEASKKLAASQHSTERWVGKDVLRDITRPLIAKRVARKEAERARPQLKAGVTAPQPKKK
jgi:3-methyladenine DNA glycosylase AlkD